MVGKVKLLLFFICFFTSFPSYCQSGYYLVYFKDKPNAEQSLSQASSYLSAKSILRRDKQQIDLEASDAPVDINFINSLNENGFLVISTSKWLNAALVNIQSNERTAIEEFSFVSHIQWIRPADTPKNRTLNNLQTVFFDFLQFKIKPKVKPSLPMGMEEMHAQGLKGEGLTVAIFDGGFKHVDRKKPFGKIPVWQSRNFVDASQNVYQRNTHGTEVLSILASSNNKFQAIVPDASYVLCVTEDIYSEYPIEEYYWTLAAEYADSLGVDIINSSLGYNQFENEQFDYQVSDLLQGKSIISKAANMAAQKGMIVVVSAGNEGQTKWKTITAPADARGVVSVGAANKWGERAAFSSMGMLEQIFKPEILAPGVGIPVISKKHIKLKNGTSYAAPLVTGLAAGVWQLYPHLSAKQVIELIYKSADQYSQPDQNRGYGIPDFQKLGLDFDIHE